MSPAQLRFSRLDQPPTIFEAVHVLGPGRCQLGPPTLQRISVDRGPPGAAAPTATSLDASSSMVPRPPAR
jgi:hypothetical protein